MTALGMLALLFGVPLLLILLGAGWLLLAIKLFVQIFLGS